MKDPTLITQQSNFEPGCLCVVVFSYHDQYIGKQCEYLSDIEKDEEGHDCIIEVGGKDIRGAKWCLMRIDGYDDVTVEDKSTIIRYKWREM